MVRIDIDDQDIIEPALLRLLPGMREQAAGIDRLRGSNWRKSLDHFQKTVNERLQVELGSLVCLNVMRGLVPRIHVFTHQGRGWPGQARP
jgi:hypothetical protein